MDDGRIRLGQLISVMVPSERVVIYDGEDDGSPELYRGFVACMEFAKGHIDMGRCIKRAGLGTDIFVRERGSRYSYTLDGARREVGLESISDFKFQDLEEIIFTRIFLEKKANTGG